MDKYLHLFCQQFQCHNNILQFFQLTARDEMIKHELQSFILIIIIMDHGQKKREQNIYKKYLGKKSPYVLAFYQPNTNIKSSHKSAVIWSWWCINTSDIQTSSID